MDIFDCYLIIISHNFSFFNSFLYRRIFIANNNGKRKKGKITVGNIIKLNASFISYGNAVGKKEYDGPLGSRFDMHSTDDRYGKTTWESAESEMQRLAFNSALSKKGLCFEDIGALCAGDLLNQCVGSAYGLCGCMLL